MDLAQSGVTDSDPTCCASNLMITNTSLPRYGGTIMVYPEELRKEFETLWSDIYGEENTFMLDFRFSHADTKSGGQFYHHGYVDAGWKVFLTMKGFKDS